MIILFLSETTLLKSEFFPYNAPEFNKKTPSLWFIRKTDKGNVFFELRSIIFSSPFIMRGERVSV